MNDGFMTEYQRLGYRNREHYLRSLAADYGLPGHVVMAAAELLGPNEDFDGLVTTLGDLSSSGEYDDEDEPDEYAVICKLMDE